MATKRVFILGAGFSRMAGMSSANGLTSLLLEKFKGVPKAPEYFQDLQTLIKWLEGNTYDNINFEQLFDLMPFDVELYKMNLQLIPPNRRPGRELPLESWLRYMEDDLRDIISEEVKKAMRKPMHFKRIKKFSSHLNSNDAVLTFNYDTLLEESLKQQNIKFHYGFEKENGCGVKILKMHGSINWLMVCRGQWNGLKYDILAEKTESNTNAANPYNVLLRVPDDDVYNVVEHRHLSSQNKDKSIGIVGLGTYKRVSDLVGSGEIWRKNAYQALRDCEQIYVIGFSFSRFDTMARLFFGRVMMERFEKKIKLPKIILIDPDANNLNKRIESIFGRKTIIELVPQEAEKVDWGEWLN